MSLVNNNDSSYLMIFTSLLHVGCDRVNDINLIFKTTKNHHAKSTFMLAPLLFPCSAVDAPLFNSRIATGGKRGHVSPGAAFWRHQLEVGMLRNNYK